MSLLAIYLRPEWPRSVLLGLLLLVGIGFQLANPQIAKAFIDRAQAGQPLQELVWIALLFMGVVVLTQAATVAETYVAQDLGWRTTNALRADLTRHVLDLDAAFHAEHGAGELIERIDGDVSAIAEFFARFVVQVLGSGVFLLGVLALLYAEDWRIGGVMTLAVLAAMVFMTRGGGFVAARSLRGRQSAGDLSAHLEEHLAGLPDLKSAGADAYAMHRLNERLAARFHSVRSATLAASIFNAIVGLLFVLGAGGALGLSAALYGTSAISLGSVFVVFRYTSMLRQPLDRLTRQMNNFQTATGGNVRVRELLTIPRKMADGVLTELPGRALSVEFRNVSFAYESEPVLSDISFRVEPGEVLGLLGRTGSGKTTISRLLFRLHDPVLGSVHLGDTDLRDAQLDAVRARVALVTQDVQLFHGTLRDNVGLFDPLISDLQLCGVFEALGLDEWLRQLPEGLDTPLGGGGRGLSAGEAQLVALARVFLKDPGLVVLDEASSRLDPHTEWMLERAITRLLQGRTGVVIAHRLATVQRADRIMILEQGRVAEFGRRSDLAADPMSRFARLLRVGMAEALA